MPITNVQIETTTFCSQRCVFCPVSTDTRPRMIMTDAVFDRIMEQIQEHPVKDIFMNGFNEPSFDKKISARVSKTIEAGYEVQFNSNGSGLDPTLTDTLIGKGLKNFNINISTLDEEQYEKTRGTKTFKRVKKNLDYLTRLGDKNDLNLQLLVLGNLDRLHAKNVDEIKAHYENCTVILCPIADYAGSSAQYFDKPIYHHHLKGCMEQRNLNWVHFTPDGKVILCCQDYYSKYILGDIKEQSLDQILSSHVMKKYQSWIGGQAEAPDDFLCRYCLRGVGEKNFQEEISRLFCHNCTLTQAPDPKDACSFCVVAQYTNKK